MIAIRGYVSIRITVGDEGRFKAMEKTSL